MLYLASKSPRRKLLLGKIISDFETLDANVEEIPQPGEVADQYVMRVALEKALAAKHQCHTNDIIIAADTEVVLDGKILGKPVDMSDAMEMLGRLSGNTHEVITGVVVTGNESLQGINKNLVSFRVITEQERHWYCENFLPLDKAGAYGIQDAAAGFIDRFEGSYSSVMGLPLHDTRQLLIKSGVYL